MLISHTMKEPLCSGLWFWIVVHEDVLEKTDSHKIELYSRELSAELHYIRIGLLNKQEGRTAGQRS